MARKDRLKDRFIGLFSTLIVSVISFLVYSYFGSFETKADAQSKYSMLRTEIKLVQCYLDKNNCTDTMKKEIIPRRKMWKSLKSN